MSANERRRRRSSDPNQAISFQLETCRRAGGLEAMILADDHGLCIAASGYAPACEEVAARVSVMNREVPGFEGEIWTDHERWRVHVRRFHIDGMELCLCAVGGMDDGRAHQVERSLRGVKRILAVAA
jgi:hypothetical protein